MKYLLYFDDLNLDFLNNSFILFIKNYFLTIKLKPLHCLRFFSLLDNLSRRILGVLDDVDRALTMIDDENKSPEAEGLRLIRTKLWQQLSLDGVSHIDAINSDFDPNLHEAITTVPPTEEFPSGRIVQVLEEGYMYKDKLLKASKVVVSS